MLTASGLPSPGSVVAGRSVYEVWLIRSNGSSVAAAYLSHNPDGTWSAVLHGDMSAYAGVAATPEPAGGSRTPDRRHGDPGLADRLLICRAPR